MTTFDMLFYFFIMIGILIGIALGVHLAYRLAQSRIDQHDERGPYYAEQRDTATTRTSKENSKEYTPTKSVFGKDKKDKQDKNSKTKPQSSDTDIKLGDRIQKQDSMSFSEFDCQFTGEDRDAKLQRVMDKQNSSYRFLNTEGENKQ